MQRNWDLYICVYYVYTHNHSVSLANWCLNSLLSSHHCLYQDHPHTVHLHCDGTYKRNMVRNQNQTINERKKGKKDNFLFHQHVLLNRRGFIFSQIARKEHLCSSVSVISFQSHLPWSHPLLHIAKRLTHPQSQFPVRKPTPFIDYNMGTAEYIITGAMSFMIKSLTVPVDITRYTVIDLMQRYLHFSGYESRQLRQEQEQYEDTAENGNCGQRGRTLERQPCLNCSHCWS